MIIPSLSTIQLVEFKKRFPSGSFGITELWAARMYGVTTRGRPEKNFDVIVKKPIRPSATFMDEFKLHARIYAMMRGKACRKYIPVPYNIRSERYERKPMYAMELAKGSTLYDLGTLTPKMLAEVRRALTCLHRLGCVHNDLHPNNIIADNRDRENPKIKLIDFGMTTCGLPKYRGSDSWKHARWMKRALAAAHERGGGRCIKPNAMWMTTGRGRRSCTHENYKKGRDNPTNSINKFNFYNNIGSFVRKATNTSIRSRSRSVSSRSGGSLASRINNASSSELQNILLDKPISGVFQKSYSY